MIDPPLIVTDGSDDMLRAMGDINGFGAGAGVGDVVWTMPRGGEDGGFSEPRELGWDSSSSTYDT